MAALAVAVALAVALGTAGCSPTVPAGTAGAAGTSCGTARTAAGVTVTIRVARGTVDCAVALRVEAGYAAVIRGGGLRGNGGGAPVTVDGWTCESYPAVRAEQSGEASECHTANAEVVAVLSRSSEAAALSTGS